MPVETKRLVITIVVLIGGAVYLEVNKGDGASNAAIYALWAMVLAWWAPARHDSA